MQKYNVLLVEDEESNMQLLRYFITNFASELSIVGEASNIEDALVLYDKTKPEIVLLDIQLQEKDAFDFLNTVDFSEFETIFITAFDSYAVKAFKYNAVDYLLKPFAIEDLKQAVEKCIRRIQERKFFEQKNYDEKNQSKDYSSQCLSIASMDKVDVIKKEDIIFCKSDGRYTTFYLVNGDEYVASKNLGEYEALLENDYFFRIHHSYIVNLDHLITITKKTGYYCEMINNISLPIAKRRQDSLRVFFKERRKK